MLHIIDFLNEWHLVKHALKIKLIIAVRKSRDAVRLVTPLDE